jgi:hypothetical protein
MGWTFCLRTQLMQQNRFNAMASMKKPPNKKEKKPYSGILAQPMPQWTILTPPMEGELAALIDKKFTALFAHYEIDATGAFEGGPTMASAWANLAFHLAREHVPGFRGLPRKRGKPAARKPDDVTLVMHVELLTRRNRLSERKAIKEIAAQKIVLGNEAALLQRYKRAKQSFLPISRGFDNLAARIGHDALVSMLEESLYGDNKEIFLSPGDACAG